MYPYYYKTKFGETGNPELTMGDARLNSRLLNVVLGVVKPKFKLDRWLGGSWKFSIEDQHNSEDEPHYILSCGSEPDGTELNILKSCTVNIPYVDNHSLENEKGERAIEQAEGIITISAFGFFGDMTPSDMVNVLAEAYAEGLKEFFPDYCILLDLSWLDHRVVH